MGNTDGLCQCGCGSKTRLAEYSSRRFGWVKGRPKRFINGHGQRKYDQWSEEDRGYITPCFIASNWQNKAGYAVARHDGKQVLLHRFLYQRECGQLDPSIPLHHKCLQRDCVRVDHLQPLTTEEHLDIHGRRKYSAAQVAAMRQMRLAGATFNAIAREYKANNAYVYRVCSGKRRQNVPESSDATQ